MKPIEFPEQNIIIAKDQPEYLPLPAYVDQEGTICLWQLTWAERITVLLTGRIWHRILNFGRPLQPQLLLTETPFVKTGPQVADR